jgi:hypothetical protein
MAWTTSLGTSQRRLQSESPSSATRRTADDATDSSSPQSTNALDSVFTLLGTRRHK